METRLCIDCLYCKIKNDKVYCKLGFFKDKKVEEIQLNSPIDFDCAEFYSLDD